LLSKTSCHAGKADKRDTQIAVTIFFEMGQDFLLNKLSGIHEELPLDYALRHLKLPRQNPL